MTNLIISYFAKLIMSTLEELQFP